MVPPSTGQSPADRPARHPLSAGQSASGQSLQQPLSAGFRWRDDPARPVGPTLESKALAEVADHLFTTRRIRLRGEREHEEWAAVARALGVEPDRLLRPRQVHGRAVIVHRQGSSVPEWDGRAPDADIIVTDDPAVAIAVQVADCIPILVADPVTGAVAAAHAGWRGSVARVAEVAVAALSREFGARLSDLVVALGPSIGPCCYEVGPELRDAFLGAGFDPAEVTQWFADASGARPPRTEASGGVAPDAGRPPLGEAAIGSRYYLDLWSVNQAQLVAAGVAPARIHQPRLCTVDHRDTFFSYRAEGAGTGRIAGAIRGRGPWSVAPNWRVSRTVG